MAKHRTHSIEFKRQVASGVPGPAARPFMGSPNDTPSAVTWIRVLVQKYEAGSDFDEDAPQPQIFSSSMKPGSQALCPKRLVGKQALELEFLKGAVKSAPRPKSVTMSVVVGPPASVVAEGCRLMGIARSTFYDKPAPQDDTAIVR